MATITQPLPTGQTWQTVAWSWITTVDHKRIAKLYLVAAAVFFAIAGAEAPPAQGVDAAYTNVGTLVRNRTDKNREEESARTRGLGEVSREPVMGSLE